VIFMGTPDFALPTLDALIEAGHELIAVVAQPDKPAGRGKKLRAPATVIRARELGIETKQPRALRRGPFPEWMEACGADVAVVVAYGRILTPRLLAAPKKGCINVHASLLPKLRGAAPIHWAVIRGHTESGVSTMQMDEGLDTGDVLLEARTAIGPEETAGALWDRLATMGGKLAVETLAGLGAIEPRPQDHAAHSLAPLMTKADGRLDWGEAATALHNRVRGTFPWPGASTTFRGGPLKVKAARVAQGSGEPGTVIEAGPRLVVAAGEGALELLEAQLPGKRAQSGSDLVNGARVVVGEVFGA
jgi:methionyl-tRNA formyltransferase